MTSFFAMRLFGPRVVMAADSVTNAAESAGNLLANLIAYIVTIVVGGVGQVVVLLIDVAVIPLMQYNAYSTSQVIGTGWAVVRDSVNMFFVIILIIIAMGTIFGISRFQWRQQVPRLLILAIVINFSRLLCGLMIDFSQVIMLTFVNALKDIAGGNFIEMLGVRSIFNFNSLSAVVNESGLQAADILMASGAALFMMLTILVALLMLVIVLAYRIAMIWMLVVMAPLAWFTKGTEGVIQGVSGAYANWWKRWICAMASGPVLTFFLWLGLAVAGSGSLSAEFTTTNNAQAGELDTGSMIEALTPARFVSFLMGMVILFQGFDQAQQICSGEAIGAVVKGGKERAKAVAQAPVALAGYVATGAARQAQRGAVAAGQFAYRETAGRATERLKGATASTLQGIARSGQLEKLPFGAGAKAALLKTAGGLQAQKAASAELAAKDYTNLKAGDQLDIAKASLASGLVSNQERGVGLMRNILTNDALRKQIDPEELKSLWKQYGNGIDKQFEGDPAWVKQKEDLFKKQPAMFGKAALDKIKEREDLIGVDKGQWKDADFLKRVDDMGVFRDQYGQTVKTKGADGKEHDMSFSEAIKDGRMGQRIQGFYTDGVEELRKKNQEQFSADSLAKMSKDNVANIDVSKLKADVDPTRNQVTTEVIAKIVKDGTDKQATDLANNVDVKSRMENAAERLNVKNAGLDAAKDEKERGAFRERLMTVTGNMNEAFDFDEKLGYFVDNRTVSPGGEKAYNKDYNEEAEKDFKAAVSTSDKLLAEATKNPKSKIAGIAASAMTPDSLKRMLRKYQDMTQKISTGAPDAPKESEADEVGKQLENAINAAAERLGEIYGENGSKIPPGLRQEVNRLETITKSGGVVSSVKDSFVQSQARFKQGQVDSSASEARRTMAPEERARRLRGLEKKLQIMEQQLGRPATKQDPEFSAIDNLRQEIDQLRSGT